MFQPWPTKAKKYIRVSVPMMYSERMTSGAAAAAARSTSPAECFRILLGMARAQEAGRPDAQHGDEEGEDPDLGERAMEDEPAQRFDHADEEPAHQIGRAHVST